MSGLLPGRIRWSVSLPRGHVSALSVQNPMSRLHFCQTQGQIEDGRITIHRAKTLVDLVHGKCSVMQVMNFKVETLETSP
jgi:hypothetical protein